MNTKSKMVVISILAALVVGISSGSYSVSQVNAQGSGEQGEQDSQTAMQKADCEQLKSKMDTDQDAAAQYNSKDCADLLK